MPFNRLICKRSFDFACIINDESVLFTMGNKYNTKNNIKEEKKYELKYVL